MELTFREIEVEREGDVFRVYPRRQHLENLDVLLIGDELLRLVVDEGCRQLCLSLRNLDMTSSLFLNKLLTVRRHLLERGGALQLCHASQDVIQTFEACGLKDYFVFVVGEEPAEPTRRPEA